MHDGIFTAAGSKLTSFNMQNVQINTNKYAQNQFAKNGTRQSASSNNEHYQEGIQKIVTFSHRL